MNASLRAVAAAAALTLALPQGAGAFSGLRNTTVNPVDQVRFEVMAPTAGNGPVYWCGAGDYAAKVLRADWTARIYVSRGRGPSDTTGRKTAVQFTMDPQAADIEPIAPYIFMNAFRTGDNMTVNEAMSHCFKPRILY